MTQLCRTAALVCAAAWTSACGTIIQGTRQEIVANSTPDAAKVTTTPATGEYQTPITLRLERKRSYSIRFEKDGYTPATVDLQHKLGAVYVILDIVLGLVPVIVDAATGGWYTLEPGSALVAMTRVAQGTDPEVIYVALSASTNKGGRVVDVTAPAGVAVRVEER